MKPFSLLLLSCMIVCPQSGITLKGPLRIAGPVRINGGSFSAVGDSLTYGNQELDGATYPNSLATLIPANVFNLGQDGATSEQILTNFQAQPQLFHAVNIFWETRNNLFSEGIATIIGNINTQIAALTTSPKTYLDMSLTNNEGEPTGSSAYTTILSANSSLLAAYPNNYLDIRSLLVAAYNPSIPADVIDHGNDIMPQSLRAHYMGGTITGNINASTCSIPISGVLSAGNSIGANSIILIGSEWIYVNAVTGTDPGPWTVTSCTRAWAGSAAPYNSGTSLQVIDSAHLNATGYAFVAQQVLNWLALKGWV